jgi:hypothetical protein
MYSSRPARRSLAALALAPALLLALAACGNSDPTPVHGAAGPAGVSTTSATTDDGGSPDASSTPTSSSTTKTTPATTSASGSTKGCAKGGGDVPTNADSAQVGDLDGDGTKDEVWLADQGSQRTLGVLTATGAVFSTTFTSASPIAASATANRLGDGSAVILLSTGRSAALYAVVDCKIVPTENKDGKQYTFDLGFTGYGTGVACPTAKGALYLAGYNTVASTKHTDYGDVTRTRIDLSDAGAKAANGVKAELGEFGNDSATYKIAHGVSCGDSETANEPQS